MSSKNFLRDKFVFKPKRKVYKRGNETRMSKEVVFFLTNILGLLVFPNNFE